MKMRYPLFMLSLKKIQHTPKQRLVTFKNRSGFKKKHRITKKQYKTPNLSNGCCACVYKQNKDVRGSFYYCR